MLFLPHPIPLRHHTAERLLNFLKIFNYHHGPSGVRLSARGIPVAGGSKSTTEIGFEKVEINLEISNRPKVITRQTYLV